MKKAKGKLKFKFDQLNARIVAWDTTQKTAKNPRAYRKPGSMKGRS